jgi:hypothetical protein
MVMAGVLDAGEELISFPLLGLGYLHAPWLDMWPRCSH